VVTASYNIVLPAADPPGFSPPSGNYNVSSGGTFSVTVSTDTPSINSSQAIIVFNTNGNTPTYTIDSNGIITATNGSGLIYNGNQVGWTIPGGHGHGSVSINALAIVNGYVIPTAVSSASYNLTW
jgi:hypothetical protein